MSEPVLSEGAELFTQTAQSNGSVEPLPLDITEDDLLTELSAETLGPREAFVHILIEHTAAGPLWKKLPVQGIDVRAVARKLQELSAADRHTVLASSTVHRPPNGNEDDWLFTLLCILYGLRESVKIKYQGKHAWPPYAEFSKVDPHTLGMLGLLETFPTGPALERLASEIVQVSRYVQSHATDQTENF